MSTDVIDVRFVDARTGSEFARSDMPLDALPESFALATTLHIRDEAWQVVSAEPPTAAEFARTGALVLTLAPVETVAPRDVLFSLPTLCDALPPVDAGDADRALRLHEDDWRQVELVSEAYGDEVAEDLGMIERVYREHSTEVEMGGDDPVLAFREVFVRRAAAEPIPPGLRLADLEDALPDGSRELAGVALGDQGLVRGGFAYDFGGMTLYGMRDGEQVSVLGLSGVATEDARERIVAFLSTLMMERMLLLVDWCRCASFEADPELLLAYLTGDE